MTVRGIGIDVADLERFRVLYARHGDRFAGKWFTDVERERCLRTRDPGGALAEHFAVKEAVWKALGPSEWAAPLPWRSIVYVAESDTACLDDVAAARADGLDVHVSVARHGAVAIATALVTVRS
ncbi:4'-phosphopantetheinyl transferase superfamily protein [Microbacterium aurum]|uniref:holo-ACP synthase n=1 Tax=Microbacterium aurum TaxID=36805 RepID=UPI0028E3559A|nr:4'-phosphopantetheinyl transferase superfamily protein [Microbacterium aurum]